MPASVTVLFSGIVRSRSLNSPLNVTLIGFYPHDMDQELGLSDFKNEDVVLATGNFRIIEDMNKNGNKELIITDDTKIVHLRSMSFPEYQKPSTIMQTNPAQSTSTPLSWELNDQDKTDLPNTIAQTIATSVKGNIRHKKSTSTSRPSIS
ncbi:19643_t:CDS:2 [Gigaspora rosea]|nr:19643_t:CDS:2 [Gigaspora rosea]